MNEADGSGHKKARARLFMTRPRDQSSDFALAIARTAAITRRIAVTGSRKALRWAPIAPPAAAAEHGRTVLRERTGRMKKREADGLAIADELVEWVDGTPARESAGC